jgi:hypothetical protein
MQLVYQVLSVLVFRGLCVNVGPVAGDRHDGEFGSRCDIGGDPG